MMKVVSSKQMTLLETQAYKTGSNEEEFMEEAGSGVASIVQEFVERYNLERHVVMLCGKGNNAGDAYVAGIYLLQLEFAVTAFQVGTIAEGSPLCRKNHERFIQEGGQVVEITTAKQMTLPKDGIILDGLFGTGFHDEVKEPYSSIIQGANRSGLPIIAIDIPSGLNGETGRVEGEAIRASETAFLGLPKTGLFLEDGWNFVGRLRYVDFGLPKQYIEESEADFSLITVYQAKSYMPPIIRTRNKYEAGYVVGLAGSPDMPGAALLASTAAICSGAGIVRLLYPEGMEAQLCSSPYEIIKTPYQYEDPSKVLDCINNASAAFIGPGMGRSEQAMAFLKNVIPKVQVPCVLDADALYFLSQNNVKLPEETILTPHRGEMKRLLHQEEIASLNTEYLRTCHAYAKKHKAVLLLKGGPSFVFAPDGLPMVNPTGDPGMATAGSGDVLTGLIAGLLAQGLTPQQATCLGAFLHGLAGEFAAEIRTSYCLTASDILDFFPEAFYAIK